MAVKGQWKTIEAVLAGIVVLMFLAALSSTRPAVQSSAPLQGRMALSEVYDKGLLYAPAAAMDAQEIDSMAGATGYLAGFSHEVVVCNATACTGDPPQADYVWAYGTVVAGDGTFAPAEVTLYVYR